MRGMVGVVGIIDLSKQISDESEGLNQLLICQSSTALSLS